MRNRTIKDHDSFAGPNISLRLVTLRDCKEHYLAWLRDPRINQYLETRWNRQTIQTIRDFVKQVRASPDSYLFAIVERSSGDHIGNIKLGPINPHHKHADVSYFIGEPSRWNKGYATEAIAIAVRIGFDQLGLHRIQAGVNESNVGSTRALEKVGFRKEGSFRKQLVGPSGQWEDHLWYGILQGEEKVKPPRPAA